MMSERPKNGDWLKKVTEENQAGLRRQLGRRFAQVHQRRRILRRVGGVVVLLIALTAVPFSVWNSDLLQSLDTANLNIADLETSTVSPIQKTQIQDAQIRDTLVKDLQVQASQSNDNGPQQQYPLTIGIELQLIDDNQLLELLAEAGQPSVLVTIDGVKKALPLKKRAMR